MKLIKEDYKENKWIFLIAFGKRKLQCEYYPKKDEADWKWFNGYGSFSEMGKARKIVIKKITMRINLLKSEK